MTTDEDLVAQAIQAQKRAYAPYSHFAVGAALLGKSGRVYTGCNVENASYSMTICAERTAVVKAVSEGEHEFEAVAVVTDNGVTPCGACRQVLAEFGPEMRVLIATPQSLVSECTVSDLLPGAFLPQDLP